MRSCGLVRGLMVEAHLGPILRHGPVVGVQRAEYAPEILKGALVSFQQRLLGGVRIPTRASAPLFRSHNLSYRELVVSVLHQIADESNSDEQTEALQLKRSPLRMGSARATVWQVW